MIFNPQITQVNAEDFRVKKAGVLTMKIRFYPTICVNLWIK